MARVDWSFTKAEIETVQCIVTDHKEDPFVQSRRLKNVEPSEVTISAEGFWKAHLTALLTSQQRSGPDSHVFEFVKSEIEDLCLEQCRETNDVSQFVSKKLEEHGGIRFHNNIGEACEKNLRRLDSGRWDSLWKEFGDLVNARRREPTDGDYAAERQVATFLADEFAGEGLHRIGPKQARNLLQIQGLTRYETPLDSRITKWVNENLDLPYEISGGGLNHSEYYHFTMDLVQNVCLDSKVLPCMFDAAVFASYDTEWSQTDAETIF